MFARRIGLGAAAWLLLLSCNAAGADTASDDFLSRAFAPQVPAANVLWLTDELRHSFEQAIGRPTSLLRVRYWRTGGRTAWILDEIGKERPITTGVVVQDGAIVSVQVLAFRESRGGEVQRQTFLRQFVDARLDGRELDRRIDGITGATLSVRALGKQARAALVLHAAVMSAHVAGAGAAGAGTKAPRSP